MNIPLSPLPFPVILPVPDPVIPRNHCLCDDTEDFTVAKPNATRPPAPYSSRDIPPPEGDCPRDERARNAYLRTWAERQVRLSDELKADFDVAMPKGYGHQECCAAIQLVVLERRSAEAGAQRQAGQQPDLTCVPSIRGTLLAALAAAGREVEAWCGAHPTAKWVIGAGIGAVGGWAAAYVLVRGIAWLVWQ